MSNTYKTHREHFPYLTEPSILNDEIDGTELTISILMSKSAQNIIPVQAVIDAIHDAGYVITKQ